MKRSFLNSQDGSSLISAIIGVGVLSLALMAVMKTTNFGFKANKSLENRSDRTILRSYVFEALDCKQTLPLNILNSAQNPIPIVLKNGLGLPILQGEGGSALGNWKIRARLDLKQKKVVIEAGRFGNDGLPIRDPMTGRPEDWSDLFSGLALCQKGFVVEQEETPDFQSMEFLGSNGCDTGGIVGGVTDVKRRYGITMSCGANTVISGGALCQHMKDGGFSGPLGIKQAIIGSGSFLVASYPTDDKHGWYAECCVSTSGVLGMLGSVLNLKKANFPVGYIHCAEDAIPKL